MMNSKAEMSLAEIEQFLTCASVGRLGLIVDGDPYIIPVGFAFANGKICFHTCDLGRKMEELRKHHRVCFEVDESLSDASMYKSVIAFGTVEILDDPKDMIPYLQLLINKYRVPEEFEDYIDKPDRNRDQELAMVRIIVITPTTITGKKFFPTH